MIISKAEISENKGKARLSAIVFYESISKPKQEIFFEVDISHKKFLRNILEPFLLSCFPAALFHGEERITIDGPICPELAANVKAAMHLQKRWWGDKNSIPIIEYKSDYILENLQNKTACFLSGGVDSLSSFCRNISLYRRSDPRRVSYAMFVYGMDVGDPNKIERGDVYENAKKKLRVFSEKEYCELIPVYTNARNIESNSLFYEARHVGALLGGIAHALSGGYNRCLVAADYRADFVDKTGSHPWLNKYFSSSGLLIESTMDYCTRLDKYNYFLKYPAALDALRVCYAMNKIQPGSINCCICSKCVRTKVELLANELLGNATTFSDKSITPELLNLLRIRDRSDLEFLSGPIDRLLALGENKVANYLQQEVLRYKLFGFIKEILTCKVKQFDRNYCGNRITSTLNRLKSR